MCHRTILFAYRAKIMVISAEDNGWLLLCRAPACPQQNQVRYQPHKFWYKISLISGRGPLFVPELKGKHYGKDTHRNTK